MLLEQIRLLIKLQAADKVAFSLERELEEIPVRLEKLAQEEKEAREEFEKLSAELTKLKEQHKSLESENETVKSRVRKAESKLMGSSNQREYRAASAELEEGRDIIKSNDDRLLEMMEKQESLELRATGREKDFNAKRDAHLNAREELGKRAEEVRKILQEMSGQRAETECLIDKVIIREYNFVRTRRQGVGISPVSKGNCGVCHMQIPPQQFNELLRADKIMHCPSCKRIIYWADDENLHA
jgi:predicted  nucleic acid-binding Zn-ribbon protein